ncbi:hypothetical protein [Actinocrispum wychmicini]|uniref:Uncharacterized protein n=1 Tax=Actinocrispum wychmicini TaxID=1213861 RepID=A0A4R2JRI7_9PSEU|nr:hypothetical protein [Actinocrispum wychmicini]TCO62134.1 hypothetical protein EV192_102271 [Actinocrispum wychmicini]
MTSSPQQPGGQPYDWPGGRPQKGTRRIVGIVAGVVVVGVVVGVGGFVWPGFFAGSRPTSVAQSFTDAIRNNDTAGAKRFVCPAQRDSDEVFLGLALAAGGPRVTPALLHAIRLTNKLAAAQILGGADVTGSTATAVVHVEGSFGGGASGQDEQRYSAVVTVQLEQQDGVWCVSDVRPVS